MIPSTRSEALAVLADLCSMSHDVRLGQLLAHLGFLGEDQTGRTLWDIDDEQFLAVLYHHRAELVARSRDLPAVESVRSPGSSVTTALKAAPPVST